VAGCDKNVGWLDITVNDALGVGGVERVSNFDCEQEQGFQLHGRFPMQRLSVVPSRYSMAMNAWALSR